MSSASYKLCSIYFPLSSESFIFTTLCDLGRLIGCPLRSVAPQTFYMHVTVRTRGLRPRKWQSHCRVALQLCSLYSRIAATLPSQHCTFWSHSAVVKLSTVTMQGRIVNSGSNAQFPTSIPSKGIVKLYMNALKSCIQWVRQWSCSRPCDGFVV
jgi:hypothetical protein